MRQADLVQLEQISRIDRLIERCENWPGEQHWEPALQARLFLSRVLPRVKTVRERLELPLVVAMLGGTGTGKSSLVNAMVGREVARSGRQRPTTLKPLMLIHPQLNLELLHLPWEECEIKRPDAPLLENMILVDCPDPDTSENLDEASNLERLRKFLPYCDVLIYTSTQQKYRSATVQKELRAAAAGCKLVFVQTHADRDVDIRADWREHLQTEYEVPELFFIDTLTGLQEQLSGESAGGELERLQRFLKEQLATSYRGKIRRDNVLDLLYASLMRIAEQLQEIKPALLNFQSRLDEQSVLARKKLSNNLQQELLAARPLWERRLTEEVIKIWGISPFSLLLRLHFSLGALLGSWGILRARTTAQVALLGITQGLRMWKEQQQQAQFRSLVSWLDEVTMSRESLDSQRFILQGYARSAGFPPGSGTATTSDLSDHQFEQEFFVDAQQQVDLAVERLARKNSSWLTRFRYDLLFLLFPGFLLYRIGKNFFYDSFILQQEILASQFYLPAILFLAIWSMLFLILFTRRLRRGLKAEIQQLVQKLLDRKFRHELFPEWQAQITRAFHTETELQHLLEECQALRLQQEQASGLGAARLPQLISVSVNSEIDT